MDGFHKDANGRHGRTTYCKECNNAKARAWTAANPEKARAQAQKRTMLRLNRPSRLRSKYNLSMEQYENLLAQQGGACAICGTSEPGRDAQFFSVDHNHTSNQVRGLLCNNCNRALGLFRDDADLMQKAAEYLESPPYQP
jgi:hypothetical protein